MRGGLIDALLLTNKPVEEKNTTITAEHDPGFLRDVQSHEF
jgi:hypothetical protein